MTKELQDKFEELIDRLEALEEAVYEGPDDIDDLNQSSDENYMYYARNYVDFT